METSSDESDGEVCNLVERDLTPYEFEPIPILPSAVVQSSEGSEGSINISLVEQRKGNTTWCRCGNCRVMESEEESICCRDDVPEAYFDGKMCITENENFRAVCLQREVLKTVLRMLNNMRGDEIYIQNKSLRHAGYRQFTWWVHNRLGRGVRKVIPSCAIWSIRNTYAESKDSSYVPFQEARDEMNVDIS